MLPFLIRKKDELISLISQQIPEGKVLQRNKLFVKCSFTNQSSSLKLIDCSNDSMFVCLQISFWNTCSRNTGDWNTSYKNTSFWNSSYLSRMSAIISVGKKLSCGWYEDRLQKHLLYLI